MKGFRRERGKNEKEDQNVKERMGGKFGGSLKKRTEVGKSSDGLVRNQKTSS